MTTAVIGDEIGAVTEWTVEKLAALPLAEVTGLFFTLRAPPFREMDGEYEAGLLDHGGALANAISRFSTSSVLLNGQWLCKAFTPEEKKQGHGYNSFRKFGKTLRKYRMKTSIAKSRYDGKPVFQLYYPEYRHSLARMNMVDEVRKISDGLYLGVGTWGFTERRRMVPLPFTHSGPIGPFVGPDRQELK